MKNIAPNSALCYRIVMNNIFITITLIDLMVEFNAALLVRIALWVRLIFLKNKK
ncbi:hypothetical protein VAEKB19_4050013 [Vibrio aestuarianus]|nr:hypothetical protein VAEKB19_4050013 [Vibrio aestuarianus]